MNSKGWKNFSEYINGEYFKKGFWYPPAVKKVHNGYTIVFENYSTGGEAPVTCTKVYTYIIPKKYFEFHIYNSSIISSIGKYFGMQDIETGDPVFDKNYIVKSNDGFKVKQLLRNTKVKNEIENFKRLNLKLKKAGKLWTKLPEGAYELEFITERDIHDYKELETIYHLITAVLDQLEEIGILDKKTTS